MHVQLLQLYILFLILCFSSCDIPQSVEWLRYGLYNQGIVVQFMALMWDCCPLETVQKGSTMCSVGFVFSVVQWLGCSTDHSPPCNAKVKNEWNYGIVLPAIPNHCPYAFMTCTGSNLPCNLYPSAVHYAVIHHSLYLCNTGPFICSFEDMLCFISMQEIFMFWNEWKHKECQHHPVTHFA
jgi:hypothetical protein